MIALILAAGLAAPCEDIALATGPVAVGLRDGDLGTPHRVCPRTEVAVAGHALLLDDTGNNNVYGQIQLQGVVDGSIMLSERTELLLRLEAFRSQQAISLVGSTYNGLGHTTVGVSTVVFDHPRTQVAWLSRAVLPTAFGLYNNQWPVALETGLSAQHHLTGGLFAHGQLSVIGSMGLGRGPKQVRMGLVPTVGLELRASEHFGVVVDLNSALLYEAPVEHLSPMLGLRAAVGRLGVGLDAMLPLVGPTPRPIVVGQLRVSARI